MYNISIEVNISNVYVYVYLRILSLSIGIVKIINTLLIVIDSFKIYLHGKIAKRHVKVDKQIC